ELLERRERRRQAAAREGVEDLRPRRREAGVAPVPERRVRRQREELRHPGPKRVRNRDCLLRGLEPDVHVEAEDQLALGDPLHRLDQLLVARLLGDVLVLVARERMRSRGSEADAELRRRVADPPAELARLLDCVTNGPRRLGRDLAVDWISSGLICGWSPE